MVSLWKWGSFLFFIGLVFFHSWSSANYSVCAKKVLFKKQKIKLAKQVLQVEVAQTSEQVTRGLMCRQSLKTGMLFIFKKPQKLSFWMKNTFIPLSIGFFDKDKKLLNTEDMEPVRSFLETPKKRYYSQGMAQYALEVPRGWFLQNQVQKGERLQFLD